MRTKATEPQFDLFGHPIEDRARKDRGGTHDYFGHVYAAEFEGVGVKIGQSQMPGYRIDSMDRFVSVYGKTRVSRRHISPRCTNYERLERELHAAFTHRNIEGELFDLTFEDAVKAIDACEFRDDSAQLAQKSRSKFEAMKQWGVFADIQAGVDALKEANESEPDPDDWSFWPDADVICQMEPLIRAQMVYIRMLVERLIEERAKDGVTLSEEQLADLAERVALEIKGSTLNRLGPQYQYGLREHPRRGLVVDVIKALPSAN